MKRCQAWMQGLPMWQFVLAYDAVLVLGSLVSSLLVGFIWGIEFRQVLGAMAGAAITGTFVAFALRDRTRWGTPGNRPLDRQ